MTSGRRIALLGWCVAVAFLLWLYSDGLRTWFIGDDFAWLGLLRQVHSFSDFLSAMFAPQAQGTIRPLSERGFFMLSEWLFGLESFPMRVVAFATMAANLALVGWLARRITGSQMAGFLAPVLWIANSAVVSVMYWNSAYNEALCPLFLLSALALFMRFAETGKWKWWWLQLVVFILGFGALEVNLVYPALAAAWVVFMEPSMEPKAGRKRLLTSLIPLFVISVAYFFIHRAVAPFQDQGAYVVRVDRRVVTTALTYWKWTILPQISAQRGHSHRFEVAAVSLVSLALLLFLVSEIGKRRYRVLFCPAWYLITLAPMLALPGHLSDYYLTIPLIGVAIMGAWGASLAMKKNWPVRGIIAAAVGIYLFAMVPATRFSTHWWLLRTEPVRGMVLGALAAHETHPGKTIVLDGITTALYEDAIEDSPFYAVGLDGVYLTPGSEDKVHTSDDLAPLRKVVLEPEVMNHALRSEQVVIYSVIGNHLRNITGVYERSAPDRLPGSEPHRVEAGNPLYAWLLGPEWFPLEEGFRWMPGRATIRIGGPRSEKDRLILVGSCPGEQLKSGPVHLSVAVDGIPLPVTEISHPESDFRRLYSLPANLLGRPAVMVEISVDRTFHATDGRELGLTFGSVEVGPER